MHPQNCLPNCISHLAKSLSQALVRKYTSNSLADLMVFPIIYINFPIFWFDLLVTINSVHCCTYILALSTS